MKYAAAWLAVMALTATTASGALAQSTVLILDTTVEGGISSAVAAQFREALHESLSQGTEHTVLSESESRDRLGGDADRLMGCGSDATCLAEAGEASGAQFAIVAAVGEAAQIYAFTVDVYDLSTGDGIYFTDDDCALCTVDEAVGGFYGLGSEAAAELGAPSAEPGRVTRGETIVLFIRARPDEARIWLNGEPIGTGAAEASVGPGDYQLTVSADGYQGVDETIVVSEGAEDMVVNVELQRGDAPPPSGPYVRSGGAFDKIDTTVVGSILTGTGVAALVAGIVLLAIDGDTTCSEGAVTECPEVYSTTGGGTVLTVLGTTALTTGVIMLLWDTLAGSPTPVAAEPPPAQVGVGFGENAGYVGVGGSF